MCDCDRPYRPNKHTRYIRYEDWRKLNIGIPKEEEMLHRWTCPKGHIVEWSNDKKIIDRSGQQVQCWECQKLYKIYEGKLDWALGGSTTPPRDPLLVEREKTHGSFTVHADVTQQLKDVFCNNGGHLQLNPRQREAISMIFHKIGRIAAGNPNFRDHWDDISGYAKLGSEACDGN